MRTYNEFTGAPAFDDIVFETRNKEYGAYILRKNYRHNVTLSLIMAIVIAVLSVIIPYMKMKAADRGANPADRVVSVLTITNLEQPVEQVKVPETPPPPVEIVKQAQYIPPVVVDSINPEEDFGLMTAEDAEKNVRNEEVVDFQVEAMPEIQEVEKEQEPFFKVEEDPSFPGGTQALLKFIYDNVIYPQIAVENNIQGRVIVKFCVTATGSVNQISVVKGLDAEVDKEVIRVVGLLPAFKPGKQSGKPVPVWFILPVAFKLNPV